MIKNLSICLITLSILTACSSMMSGSKYSQPTHLLFQNKKQDSVVVHIKRDQKLCSDDKIDNQNCPIKFYIDDFKAGEFYISNSTKYYLSPNDYVFKVKNCTVDCFTNELKVKINPSQNNTSYILSIDENDKPYIITQ